MERWNRMLTHMLFPIAFVFSFPWFFPFENVIHLAQTFAITYIVIVGLNLWVGVSNQLSLGHVGFYAIGAYGAAILSERMGVPFLLAILLAGGIAGGTGVLLFVLSFRLKKFYFAIVTLVFGIFISLLVTSWGNVTGPSFFGVGLTSSHYFWLVGIAAVLVSYTMGNLLKGRYGRTFMALGNSEQVAQTVGISLSKWKGTSFAISAFLGGIGGGFLSFQNGFTSSPSFQLDQSILFLLGVIVGGAGFKWGPALGTLIVILLPQWFSTLAVNPILIYGSLFLLFAFLLPDGLVGTFLRLPMIRKLKREMGKIFPFHKEPLLDLSIMEERAILEDQGVSLHFGQGKAISGLGLRIKPGEIYGLIDPHCSETFQKPQVFQDLLVIENVILGFHRHFQTGFLSNLFDMQQAEKEEQMYLGKAYDLLRLVGLENRIFLKPASLSYGEKRRVEVARALAMMPPFIRLDEPFSQSSPEEVEKMIALICRLKDAGLSILILEHHMERVMTICDRITVLGLGEKIAEGSPEEILQNEKVN